jgi:hypothetical protein
MNTTSNSAAGGAPAPSSASASDCTAAVAHVVRFFETLTPSSVPELARWYSANARFKDPFNDVVGPDAIAGVFAHMFTALEGPRFVVTGQVVQGLQCFLTWEFRFCFKNFKQGQPQVILGASHLVFSTQGQVTMHRDYWDAAEELYEKLPLVGGLVRWLKQRASR